MIIDNNLLHQRKKYFYFVKSFASVEQFSPYEIVFQSLKIQRKILINGKNGSPIITVRGKAIKIQGFQRIFHRCEVVTGSCWQIISNSK